jgi:putative transposase
MVLLADEIYHVYNQGNNKERIFFQERNYNYFLSLTEKFILPYCDILAYCLMPNHFHFLIHCDDTSVKKIKQGGNEITQLSNGFRKLQLSYAQAINKQENRTGSLFRQNSKAKLISDELHAISCFHYIHQNPLRAGLVTSLSDWQHSSFQEYLHMKGICNFEKATQLLNINFDTFIEDSERELNSELISKIVEN